jgi:hypothetical protein
MSGVSAPRGGRTLSARVIQTSPDGNSTSLREVSPAITDVEAMSATT